MTDGLAAKPAARLVELLLHVVSEAVHDQETVVQASVAVPALGHVPRDGQVGQPV